MTEKSSIQQLDPQQAWQWLIDNPDAVLVDVRTDREWALIGVPDLTDLGRQPIFIQWLASSGELNESFLETLHARVPQETPVAFLCKAGGRSQAAATAALGAGYTQVVNVLTGFEGQMGPSGKHDQSGWKIVGLPWNFN